MLPPMLECGDVKPMCGNYDGPMLSPMLEFGFDRPICCDGPILPQISNSNGIYSRYYEDILPSLGDNGCGRPICYDGPTLSPMPNCGYDRPVCYDGPILPPMLELGCRPRCNEALVLPPLRVELPQDLGYFPSAVPLVIYFIFQFNRRCFS